MFKKTLRSSSKKYSRRTISWSQMRKARMIDLTGCHHVLLGVFVGVGARDPAARFIQGQISENVIDVNVLVFQAHDATLLHFVPHVRVSPPEENRAWNQNPFAAPLRDRRLFSEVVKHPFRPGGDSYWYFFLHFYFSDASYF